MEFLVVQIVRFVDPHQPGFVACEFVDANGKSHTVIDKVPVLSRERLDESTKYPKPGMVGCEVVARWRDQNGRNLARVTTGKPWGIESTAGATEFEVLATQLESTWRSS
jgi:hypothetical protein